MKKIVLIGDSIRKGYDIYVKKAFIGVAEVYYPEENCRFSSYVLRYLEEWADAFCGKEVDLVHFNAGLWDSLVLWDGKKHLSIKEYKNNLDRICKMIKVFFPKAKIVFALSTPANEEYYNAMQFKRYNKDIKAYNKVAVKVVKKHGAIINDLYSLLENVPNDYRSDGVHFYTRKATELISNQVISVIKQVLDIKANTVDYDKEYVQI